MNKLKLFLENFIIYGIGGVIGKIIPLIMLPIVTRLMPNTEYYGISDLSTTVVSFCSAIALMGMYDAMYRMFFERDEVSYKKDICSTTLFYTMCTSLIVFIVMILCKDLIAKYVFGDIKYNYLVYITAFTTLFSTTNSIVLAPTRMQNKRKSYLFMNTLSPIISYTVALILLLRGYYLISLPIGAALSGLSCELTYFYMNREWFHMKSFHKEYLKPLLKIAIPLLPNFLIYWIFNSCDKIMITNLIGAAATGVYSVGSKTGHVSQLIYTAFAGGWQYFAFSTMRDKNQVETNSKIFEYLGIISFSCVLLMFVLCHPIFNLLFTGDYINGYIVSPYLFFAPLLQMLFQVAANQFLVVKKTWPNSLILLSGAIINIFLNLFLIPRIGIEGAAIATMVGYAVSDMICVIVLSKMKLIRIEPKFFLACLVVVGYIILWRFVLMEYIFASFLVSLVCILFFLALYKKDLLKILSLVKK